jgi:hypothetical protein
MAVLVMMVRHHQDQDVCSETWIAMWRSPRRTMVFGSSVYLAS